MKLRIVIIAALGLVVAFYLVMHVGVAAVVSAVVAVGGGGFAVLCLYALGPFLILGAAWYVLLPGCSDVRLKILVWARMVRDATSEVLPFSQLGGIVMGARTAILCGISQPRIVASTIVDVTTEMLAQIAYIALGLAIVSARTPRTSFTLSLTTGLIIGLIIAVPAGGVLLALQRHSRRMTGRITARIFPGAVAATAAVSDELDAIYCAPLRVGISSALHFAGWIASAIGAWIAFRLMGAKIDLAAVLAIESLICATRSIAFFIPNALGVQEAAYAMLSPLFGVGAEIGLAVSLLKRARDIAVGVPILLIWQGVEGQRALAQVRAQTKTP